MNKNNTVFLLLLLLGFVLAGCQEEVSHSDCESDTGKPAASCAAANVAAVPASRWISSWGTSIYTHFPNGPLTQSEASPNTGLFIGEEAWNQSFRMMIHPTTPGDQVRIRFSNVFGDRPLVLENANVALRVAPTGPAVAPGSLVPLTFDGKDQVTIPPGEQVTSDGVDFSYEFGDTLAVSFHVPGPSGPMSWHAEAFATQYLSVPNSGNVTMDETGANFLNVDRGWFFLSGMESRVLAPERGPVRPGTIVAFGDSITDGFVSTFELNERWPDFLAERIQQAGLPVGVVNAGINSNTVTEPDDPITRGQAGVRRFYRDALEQEGVKSVFVLLGSNDISSDVSAETIYQGLVDLADQAHAVGVPIVVSTILPRSDPPVPFGWNAPVHEPIRQALNRMILESEVFDAVVDLSTVMENPLVPNQPFLPYYTEALHPNPVGMRVIANAIPLETLIPELGRPDRP